MSEILYHKRELISWRKDACICNHSEQAHRQSGCKGLTGDRKFDRNCACEGYHSKDNLKFLEKKYEEMLEHGRRKDKNK